MYRIELTKAARKEYLKLPSKIRVSIHEKIQRLAEAPFDSEHDVKALQGIKGCYRLRAGDFRVIYRLQNQILLIEIIKIAHRKEVYQ